jgi:hypothetical protein
MDSHASIDCDPSRNPGPLREPAMTSPATIAEELAGLRRRIQAVLHDSSRPLAARMEEFRRLLRESRLCAARTEIPWRSLQDSY